jgi:hypothetical protein
MAVAQLTTEEGCSSGMTEPKLNGGQSLSRLNIAIAVTDDARDYIHEVAALCRACGFERSSILEEIGVLLGSVELANIPDLKAVHGVAAVEIERSFRVSALPPGGGT